MSLVFVWLVAAWSEWRNNELFEIRNLRFLQSHSCLKWTHWSCLCPHMWHFYSVHDPRCLHPCFAIMTIVEYLNDKSPNQCLHHSHQNVLCNSLFFLDWCLHYVSHQTNCPWTLLRAHTCCGASVIGQIVIPAEAVTSCLDKKKPTNLHKYPSLVPILTLDFAKTLRRNQFLSLFLVVSTDWNWPSKKWWYWRKTFSVCWLRTAVSPKWLWVSCLSVLFFFQSLFVFCGHLIGTLVTQELIIEPSFSDVVTALSWTEYNSNRPWVFWFWDHQCL